MAKYTELSINQKINYKSGWDIAIAKEGAINNDGKVYCKLTKCISATNINISCCEQDYNDTQKHRILDGGRSLVKKAI